MLASLIALTAFALITGLLLLFRHCRRRPRFFRRPLPPEPAEHGYNREKPAWVKSEVIKLKVRMPHDGCRAVANAFNALHRRKGETVGKTYVANTIKRHQLQIRLLRSELKNRPRRQGPRNLIWGLDLTFLARDKRSPKPVLGVVDHGTRALLVLRDLRDRSTIGILRLLLDAIERFGRPRFVRTDNDAVFASPFFSLALLGLGIRHQRTDPFCPWQNGRIERLFHSLKQRLYVWWTTVGVPDDAQPDLDAFRAWYNHARPHQSLAGLTPAMAWDGITTARSARFYSDWEGILTGIVSS